MMKVLIAIVGILLLFSGATRSAIGDGPCERERIQWSDAVDSLKKAMDDYSSVKNESVTPKINEIMAIGTRNSMAASIQLALRERANRMAEIGSLCQEAAAKERTAYDIWRRCGASLQRRNPSPQPLPATVSRERDKLVAQLQDLLMDEAYVQYKGQAAVSANGSSGYEPEQREASQDDRWRGNRGQAPSGPWPGYQGYYR